MAADRKLGIQVIIDFPFLERVDENAEKVGVSRSRLIRELAQSRPSDEKHRTVGPGTTK